MSAKRLGWAVVPFLAAATLAAGSESRLIEAVKQPDLKAVRALLAQHIDVNVRAADGSTALLWAAYRNDLDAADALIGAGADANAVNQLGVSALWAAADNGSAAMIGRLLKAGANPNGAPPSGGTPLMRAVFAGQADAVRALLTAGANPNAVEPSHDQTALMFAASARRADLVKLLVDAGADVHARSRVWHMPMFLCCPEFNADPIGTVEGYDGGYTPLMFVARNGGVEAAQVLLAAGATVNDAAPDGTQVLALAAYSAQSEVAAFLLDHGANVNANGGGYTALHAAILRNNPALVKALLEHGADPNITLTSGTIARRNTRDYAFNKSWVGATPFWLASAFQDAAMMKMLAANGADTKAAKKDGTTPLIGAAQWEGRQGTPRTGGPRIPPRDEEQKTLEAVKLVLELGADVNETNDAGNTAMHRAAAKRFNSVVQFLAEKGARLDVRNKRGFTPIDSALNDFGGVYGYDVGGLPKGAFDIDGAIRVTDDGTKTAELLRKLGAKN